MKWRKSNCLFFALGKLRRDWDDGGYIRIRQSHAVHMFHAGRRHPLRWLPHFQHIDKHGRVTQFVPTKRQVLRHRRLPLWRVMFEVLWFEGQVIGDDKPEP